MISPRQLRMLQTLWGLFCRQSQLDPKDREARLQWVGGAIGKPVASFRDLSANEANIAIDAIEKQLPSGWLKKKRPSRRLAKDYGTAGRRGHEQQEIRLVDAGTLELLNRLLVQLGWTRERLDAFLHSAKSPVLSGAVRTLGEANRVIWALKRMLRHREPIQSFMASDDSLQEGLHG
jgi:hypothetical protein